MFYGYRGNRLVAQALSKALSPKRLELAAGGPSASCPSIKALAIRLRRDYKRVYEDVETLTACGLLHREDGGVSAPYDAITAEMRLE